VQSLLQQRGDDGSRMSALEVDTRPNSILGNRVGCGNLGDSDLENQVNALFSAKGVVLE
jgi:hypothetical protein